MYEIISSFIVLVFLVLVFGGIPAAFVLIVNSWFKQQRQLDDKFRKKLGLDGKN